MQLEQVAFTAVAGAVSALILLVAVTVVVALFVSSGAQVVHSLQPIHKICN
jgi:hypothetical protein